MSIYTFSQLQKLSKKDMQELPVYRLAVLGDCATQHLVTALRGQGHSIGLSLEVFEADYDQILPQVMDSGSEMYEFKPDAILVFMCSEKLYLKWCDATADERAGFADETFKRIEMQWGQITSHCNAKVVQYTFTENDDGVFGSYACKYKESYIYQLRRLNTLLMDGASRHKNVFLVDLCGIGARFGRGMMFSPKLYYLAKMPISLDALPTVAAATIDVIASLRGTIKKCVVLDLDNTLWGGVIGDDGLSGIEIGELGTGAAFSALQSWLKELKKRGIILAVCSKNEEAAAKEPFLNHDEMILRLEDISVFIANWEDKAANIRTIQQVINIGFDSMVFIDDNPFERNAVRSLIPDITVPDLPEDPAEYLSFLQGLNLFETASVSKEDADRTGQYQTEAKRIAMQQQFENYDEYLQSLEMSAVCAPFDEFHTPRIAQLTQRSNQFNLRTIRYTEAEITEAASDPNRITLYFTLKDKLSDYGLISVVIMEKKDEKTLFINTWLMSCRVLKRGMEEFIVNKMIETARAGGFETVIGEYIKAPKNAMVADIYGKLGFESTGEGMFTAQVGAFEANKTWIKGE